MTAAQTRFPHVPGPRPLPVRLINAYVSRLRRAAAHDPVLGVAFMRVANLIDPPPALFRPAVLLRVLVGNLRHRPVAPTAALATRDEASVAT